MSNMSSKNQNQSLQDNLDVQDYNSCQHLLDYKAKHGVRGFRVLQKCLWTGPSGKARIMRDAKEIPSCAICGRPHGRLYACVICASIGCWKLPDPHASRHAQTHPGHELAVDVDRAELFCVVCYDQIYDPDFDRAVICAQSFLRCQSNGSDEDDRRNVQGNGSAVPNGNECGASRRTSCKETESSGRRQPGEGKGGSAEADGKGHLNGFSQAAGVSSSAKKRDASCVPVRSRSGKDLTNGRKGSDTASTTNSSSMTKSRTDSLSQSETWKRRRGAEYKPWVPTAGEELVLKQGSTPLGEGSGMPSGLRGLNNLGNTCFMNSVLQALLHTPPLRNYFLSDRHNRALCQKRASHLCLGCDMDTIFSAAFSGDRSPYSPAEFLYSWWRHAANLAGYEQQDAHEFFISTVDGIHANSGTISPRAKSSQSGGRVGDVDCQCIVHRVFSGLLRSDVTCTVCGFTSTTHDPCVDISLDLEPDTGDSGPLTTESHHHRGSSVGNNGSGTSTLLGCLDRFTRQERLGVNEKFHCQKCQTRQESIKQMSVRKLPLVLCFHIKRFEHSTTRNTSRKVDRYMQFPLCLDMTPYLSSSIVRLRLGNRMLVVDNEEMGQLSERPSPHFELFAVVTHSGKLDSGHYVSYLRLGDQWYKCDDAWVTRVSEDVVRASQGYMLYYVQKKLGYKASEHLPAEKSGNHEDSGGVSTVSP